MALPEPPVVFAGPSLRGLSRAERTAIELRPPAKRGDIEALLQRKPGTALIVDGLFGAQMAVTPTECRQVLEAGWRLCGAASIGALRASELWSVGMLGLGEIYALLRLGVVDADAEVAVAYHPETFAELGASLVHVRAVLARAVQRGLEAERARLMLDVAREIYWAERSWSLLGATWRAAGVDAKQFTLVLELGKDPAHHPKVRDAEHSVGALLADLWLQGPTPNELDETRTNNPVQRVDRKLEETYGGSIVDCAR